MPNGGNQGLDKSRNGFKSPQTNQSLGPLLVSREEAERIRRAHGEARYWKERKTRIDKTRKHLGLALHWVDRLIELERSFKDPGSLESK